MKFDRQLRPATGTSWVVSYGGKTIPRWRTAAILKIDMSPYLSEKSSDFHDVIKKWKSCIGQTPSSTERISCSKTTTLLPSAKRTRPLFKGRTGCGGRPSGKKTLACDDIMPTGIRLAWYRHMPASSYVLLCSLVFLHFLIFKIERIKLYTVKKKHGLTSLLFTSDKGGGKCFCPCLFVCLFVCMSVSKITQKRVHGFGWNVACRQMSGVGTWTNWLTFKPDQDYSPDDGTGLLSPISYALQRGILLR